MIAMAAATQRNGTGSANAESRETVIRSESTLEPVGQWFLRTTTFAEGRTSISEKPLHVIYASRVKSSTLERFKSTVRGLSANGQEASEAIFISRRGRHVATIASGRGAQDEQLLRGPGAARSLDEPIQRQPRASLIQDLRPESRPEALSISQHGRGQSSKWSPERKIQGSLLADDTIAVLSEELVGEPLRGALSTVSAGRILVKNREQLESAMEAIKRGAAIERILVPEGIKLGIRDIPAIRDRLIIALAPGAHSTPGLARPIPQDEVINVNPEGLAPALAMQMGEEFISDHTSDSEHGGIETSKGEPSLPMRTGTSADSLDLSGFEMSGIRDGMIYPLARGVEETASADPLRTSPYPATPSGFGARPTADPLEVFDLASVDLPRIADRERLKMREEIDPTPANLNHSSFGEAAQRLRREFTGSLAS